MSASKQPPAESSSIIIIINIIIIMESLPLKFVPPIGGSILSDQEAGVRSLSDGSDNQAISQLFSPLENNILK